jgi:hypothetical protein
LTACDILSTLPSRRDAAKFNCPCVLIRQLFQTPHRRSCFRTVAVASCH